MANIFDDDAGFGGGGDNFFAVGRNRQHTVATMSFKKDVNALEFALSKPKMANKGRRGTVKVLFDSDESN